jgi:predicted component of type VI protein secretion system
MHHQLLSWLLQASNCCKKAYAYAAYFILNAAGPRMPQMLQITWLRWLVDSSVAQQFMPALLRPQTHLLLGSLCGKPLFGSDTVEELLVPASMCPMSNNRFI